MSMPGTRSYPKLRVSARWASHVGISGVEKAKPLSFGVQIFLKSTVFQQRIQHTFGWESGFERGPISAT